MEKLLDMWYGGIPSDADKVDIFSQKRIASIAATSTKAGKLLEITSRETRNKLKKCFRTLLLIGAKRRMHDNFIPALASPCYYMGGSKKAITLRRGGAAVSFFLYKKTTRWASGSKEA